MSAEEVNRVEVKPELIRWAIERSGRSSTLLENTFPLIQQWETGDIKPTMRQLEQLAKKTWTPLGYFFLAVPPKETLPVFDFRTVRDKAVPNPSPNLIDTVYAMQRRQAWMHEYLIEIGREPLSFIKSAATTDDIYEVAGKMRTVLGIHKGWAGYISTWRDAVSKLREAAEEAGIMVVINGVVGNNSFRHLDPDEFRGFVLSDDYAPLVFVNGSDARSAQLFTLAHELAHLWIGKGGLFNLPELRPSTHRVERFCNQVAAEFLIPADELQRFWPTADDQSQPFQAIAKRFKVSPIVAARRVWDLGLIDRSYFLDFFQNYQGQERKEKKRGRGGGDFYNNQNVRVGRRFARTVMQAAKKGSLSYRDAYNLTGLYGSTFDRYAKTLGINL